MAKLVNLPNGKQGSFPDDMSWDNIQSVLQKQFPSEESSNEQNNQSLLQKSGNLAQKYINDPVESALQGGGDFMSGLLQGTANIVPGTINLGKKALNLLPGVNIPESKALNFAPNNMNAFLGEMASYLVPGGALKTPSHIQDIPKIANAIKQASQIVGKSPTAISKIMKTLSSTTAKTAGSNALLGSVMNPEDQESGAIEGGLGSLAGSAIGKSVPYGLNKIGIGKTAPGRETLDHLQPSDVESSVKAGERLGTPLRPSEASKNPFIAGQEGRFTRTSEAAYENVKSGMERTDNEKKAINKLLSTIYDKSAASDNKIKSLYEQAARWNLKPEIVNQLKEDPLISNAFDEVSKDPAWQRNLKNVDENNIAYLDKVKRELYDKEKGMKKTAPGKANEYKEARDSLVNTMDNAVPIYKKARNAAELKITRNNIQNKLQKSEVSGSEFFNKIIKNDQKYKELNHSLRNVPEAQQQLQDMKDSWHSLINIEKPNTASYQSEKSLNQARGSLEKIEQYWNQLTGKKKNLEAVKFIRSGKWFNELQKANVSGKNKEFDKVLSNILGKIAPGSLNSIKEEE